MDINKVRNLHCHVEGKVGMESIRLLSEWENMIKKMADFWNHKKIHIKVH